MNDIDYSKLNPGIRGTVNWLREKGYNTITSGDGSVECECCHVPFPYVDMEVDPKELVSLADKLRSQLSIKSIETVPAINPEDGQPCIQAIYDPAMKEARLTLINVKLDGFTFQRLP